MSQQGGSPQLKWLVWIVIILLVLIAVLQVADLFGFPQEVIENRTIKSEVPEVDSVPTTLDSSPTVTTLSTRDDDSESDAYSQNSNQTTEPQPKPAKSILEPDFPLFYFVDKNPPPYSIQSDIVVVVTTNKSVNIRSTPGTGSSDIIIARMNEGIELVVLYPTEENAEFYKVEFGLNEGWVHKDHVNGPILKRIDH